MRVGPLELGPRGGTGNHPALRTPRSRSESGRGHAGSGEHLVRLRGCLPREAGSIPVRIAIFARVSQPAEDAGSDPVRCGCNSRPWYHARVVQPEGDGRFKSGTVRVRIPPRTRITWGRSSVAERYAVTTSSFALSASRRSTVIVETEEVPGFESPASPPCRNRHPSGA